MNHNKKVRFDPEEIPSWYSGVDAAGKAIYSYTQNGIVKGAGYQDMTIAEMIARYKLK